MAINLIHVLNEPISYALVSHDELKKVFEKFKKILKKFDESGIITVENQNEDKLKITLSFIDRLYEIRFSTGYVNNMFLGKISAWRKLENTAIEIGAVSFNSLKGRITDSVTNTEGSLHEAHFCRTLVYAWLLKDIGWDITQINNRHSSQTKAE